MTIADLYNVLSKYIKSYHKLLSASNEIVIRCPYCGDSVKHINKGHFYIGQKGNAFLYSCKRAECNATGLLNKNVLKLLEVHDLNLLTYITKLNNSLSILTNYNNSNLNVINNNSALYDSYKYDQFIHYYPQKMEYLYKRLYNFNIEDFNQYRIILSPVNFFESFNINKNNLRIINELENNTIGFLNSNGSVITFRYINPNSKYRYFNLKLNDDMNIYTIANTIELDKINTLNINICEGIFDIINIKNRLKKDINNEIFAAVNGSDYINKIEYIAKISGIVNMNINIYKDQDMPKRVIDRQFKYSLLKNNYKVFYNTYSKDYSEDKLFILEEK